MERIIQKVSLLLVIFLLLGSSASARAQADYTGDEAVRKLYTDFFEALRSGGLQGAIANLRQSGSIDPQVAEALERRLQSDTYEFPVGQADSYTVVGETEILHTLRYRSVDFLSYHERGPVAWRIRFYQRVTGRWVISDVRWVQGPFVEDFLRMSTLQYTAYQAMIEMARDVRKQR